MYQNVLVAVPAANQTVEVGQVSVVGLDNSQPAGSRDTIFLLDDSTLAWGQINDSSSASAQIRVTKTQSLPGVGPTDDGNFLVVLGVRPHEEPLNPPSPGGPRPWATGRWGGRGPHRLGSQPEAQRRRRRGARHHVKVFRQLTGLSWLLGALALIAIGGMFAAIDAAISTVSLARVQELVREERPGAVSLAEVMAERPRYINLVVLLRITCEITATVLLVLFLYDNFGLGGRCSALRRPWW